MIGGMIMNMNNMTFVKPNVGNLKGKVGKSIIETLRNAQRPDRTDLEADVKRLKEEIMANRKNEQ